MTDDAQTIREIRGRLNAATPGPWFACVNDLIGGKMVNNVDKPAHALDCRRPSPERTIADMTSSDADTEFIAHSRADVEWLLADRDRLTEQLARLEEERNDETAELMRVEAGRELLEAALRDELLPLVAAAYKLARDKNKAAGDVFQAVAGVSTWLDEALASLREQSE